MSGALLTLVQLCDLEDAARQGRFHEHLLTLPRAAWTHCGHFLIVAIRNDDVRAVRMLLRAGADPNATSSYAWVRSETELPIGWAALPRVRNTGARVEIINLLCAAGADLRRVWWNGSPLADAVAFLPIQRALLRNGAPSLRFSSNVPRNRRAIIALLACKRCRRVMPHMDRNIFRLIALEAWAARDE